MIGATLVLLICILLPALWRKRSEVCQNNLKNIGVAFRIWPANAPDYPMHTLIAFGGTSELVNTGQTFVHFEVMSNELDGPRVLVCPKDKAKLPAADFGSSFNNMNVSYFVGADADDTMPQAFLSGDRNLATSGAPVRSGLLLLGTNTPLAWTKSIHHSCGYVLLADGSVQFYDSALLTAAVRGQGLNTNRLSIP